MPCPGNTTEPVATDEYHATSATEGWLMDAAVMFSNKWDYEPPGGTQPARESRAYMFFWNQFTTDFSRLIFFCSCRRP